MVRKLDSFYSLFLGLSVLLGSWLLICCEKKNSIEHVETNLGLAFSGKIGYLQVNRLIGQGGDFETSEEINDLFLSEKINDLFVTESLYSEFNYYGANIKEIYVDLPRVDDPVSEEICAVAVCEFKESDLYIYIKCANNSNELISGFSGKTVEILEFNRRKNLVHIVNEVVADSND